MHILRRQTIDAYEGGGTPHWYVQRSDGALLCIDRSQKRLLWRKSKKTASCFPNQENAWIAKDQAEKEEKELIAEGLRSNTNLTFSVEHESRLK